MYNADDKKTLQILDVNSIELDSQNPRISLALDMYGPNPKPIQISMALTESTDKTDNGVTVSVLKQSIKANGGISQPIIVNHSNGKYTVIEGNTRLQIYKDFLESGTEGDWSKIIAVVFENMTKEQMHTVRLQSHIVGARPWNAYSKAKYLKKLRDEEHMSTTQIIDICGGKKSEINEFIDALEDMEKYYHDVVDESKFDVSRFSAFREMTKSKKLQAAMNNNNFGKADFGKWIIDGKIGEAVNVRKLADVLNNKNTREIFLEEGLNKAISHLDNPISASLENVNIGDLADLISKKIAQTQWDEIQAYKAGRRDKEKDSLAYLREIVSTFLDEMD